MLTPIPRELRLNVALVIALGTLALLVVSVPPPPGLDLGRIFFWMVVTFTAAALPVRLEGGVVMHTTTAPLIAAVFDSTLPHPFAACWIALVGTIELRDIRRELAWYGTLYNRFSYVLSTLACWAAVDAVSKAVIPDDPLGIAAEIAAAGFSFGAVNLFLAVTVASIRTKTPITRVWALSIGNVLPGLLALVPLGWLMAEMAIKVGVLAAALFMVPLLLARYSFTKYAETRKLFFGTVSALSQAIDAKDGFTRGHADRVSRIAGAVAREMGLQEKTIEQVELAGLLHDIGKIGVEDQVLMKPTRLDPNEKELMQRHPIYGASILEPSSALRPLVPMILHHHENFDGTGYPEGLKGEEIPLGARIIIVADAYEAMTSDRVYRKSIGHERALEQLNRYKGVQFDPKVVRALDQLLQRRGAEAFEVSDLPAINYETLAELRRRLAREPMLRDSHAG